MTSDRDLASLENNKVFYGRLYRRSNPLFHLLRAKTSFDQQSKSRVNLNALRPYIGEKGRQDVIRLLDYGCGWGTFLLETARVYPNIELFCFDIVEDAVENLQRTMATLGTSVTPLESNNNGFLSGESSFDFIVCSHVLEHVESDKDLIKQFLSMLAPDGYLLVNVPINEVWNDPKHIRRYTQQTIVSLIETSGYSVEFIDQVDRWTSYLLTHETKPTRALTLLPWTRGLRLSLSLLPPRFYQFLEYRLLRNHQPQQCVVIAKKNV